MDQIARKDYNGIPSLLGLTVAGELRNVLVDEDGALLVSGTVGPTASGQNLQQVTDNGATTSNKVTLTNDLVLAPVLAKSPTPVDGEITYCQGEMYYYDATRTQFLSFSRSTLVFSRNGNNLKSQYLRVAEIASSVTGTKMPKNGVVTKITANSRNISNVVYEIRKNGADTVLAQLIINGTKGGYNNYLNLSFSANDDIQLFMNVQSGIVDYPVLTLECAWRLNGI